MVDDVIGNPQMTFYDTKNQTINLYSQTTNTTMSYTRVTIPPDGGLRIISVGFNPIEQINAWVASGRLLPK